MERLEVNLSGLKLDNPIIPASGTFGFGYEFAEFYDINVLGSISIKGTTLEARYGNATPRIAECTGGLLNSIGLQNPGVQHIVEDELKKLKKVYHKPIIANISGFSIDEYVQCAKMMDQEESVGIIEVNISCPNVHQGGMSFGTDPKCAAEVTAAVKEAVCKPVYVKLTPNVTDIVEIAKAVEKAGADGISMINTLQGMKIDIRTQKPVLANKMGGFSGPAIKPVAVRMIYQVYEAVSIPIIGMGGIASAEDVLEMMMAGASAVQIGAENLRDPYACKKIIDQLPSLMDELNIKNISEIIGRAHR